jgi:hypothetical protein
MFNSVLQKSTLTCLRARGRDLDLDQADQPFDREEAA